MQAIQDRIMLRSGVLLMWKSDTWQELYQGTGLPCISFEISFHYNLEGRGFKFQWGNLIFSIYPILPAAPWPWGLLNL
jgi:hypothetical protein